MQSASKVPLATATLARWTKTHLGKTLVSSREITTGWYNTIHVLELADAQPVVLKVSPPPTFQSMRYERDILQAEIDVLRRLHSAGVRVPKILAESPGGDGLGHPWFMMEFLEGEPWDQLRKNCPPAHCDTVDAAIGRQSALVNSIRTDRFGRWHEDRCARTSWATSFLAMVDDLLADARDKSVRLPRSEADLRRLVESSHKVLDEVVEPSLVLWDLHDGNVIVRPGSLEIMGLLDTDRSLWGDPLMEYYFRTVADVSSAWKDAYGSACLELEIPHPSDTPGASRRLALYDLYLGLVLVTETAYRGYGPEHEEWVRGLLDDALALCETKSKR